MNREVHVRFCEGLGVKFPRATHLYDRKTIHTIEAVGHVARSSRSHPLDAALRACSGQAVDLQETTSEPGIRVAEYCLVIDQWRRLLWPRGDRQRSEVMP